MKLAQKILVVLMILAVMPAQAGNGNKYRFKKFGAPEITACKVAAKQIKLVVTSNCEGDDIDQESIDCYAARAIKKNNYSETSCADIMYVYEATEEK